MAKTSIFSLEVKEYVRSQYYLHGERVEPEQLVPLMERMKSGMQALVVIVFAGALSISILACPLWMASINQAGMPNEDCSNEKCSATICIASSSYLASDINHDISLLKDLAPTEAIEAMAPLRSLRRVALIQSEDGAAPGPPNPIFLWNRAFLI